MRRSKTERPLARLRDQIDRIFEQPDFGFGDFFGEWAPAVDILEDRDKLTVKAELPGFRREDIQVSLHEDNLIVSGERNCEDEQKEGRFYRCERYYGRFQRAIPLPFTVEPEKIHANYRDGVLTVTLAKSEKAKAKQIAVGGE